MRRLALVALSASALLFPLACEDPSSSSGGAFTPEAGAGFEGGQPGEAGAPPEAGPLPEAGADQFVPPKGVTVSVFQSLTPKAGVRVLSHDATGAVTGDASTDATGKVALAIAPSMVTVLSQNGFNGTTPAPVTFMGVADGDALVVTVPSTVLIEPVSVGAFSVSFQQGGVIAGADTVAVANGLGCANSGNPASPVVVSLYGTCVAAQNALLATATSEGTIVGFGFAKAVAKPALNQTTSVGPLAFAAPGATTVTAANLPAATFDDAELNGAVGGASFAAESVSGALDAGGVVFATPTGFADAYQALVRATSTVIGPQRARTLLRREATNAPASATMAFDFATALPDITGVTISKAVPARAEVTVVGAAPLTAADGAVASLSWVTAQDATARWTFVLPPSTTTFKAPALPVDAPDFAPGADVGISSVVFVEASQLPGYAELKALPVTPGVGVSTSNANLLLPGAGSARTSRWTYVGPTF